MTFEFNPAKKVDDKGAGKIHLGDSSNDNTSNVSTTPEKTPDAPKSAARKWLIIGAGSLALIGGLTGIFALSSHKTTQEQQPVPTPVTQTYQQPARSYTPPPAVQNDRSTIMAQSIQDKESVIYRDDATAYHDQTGARAEAYLTADGREVKAGQDFAMHVSLFNKGGISILVAAGPYAGSRVEFIPVTGDGSSHMTYTKVGTENLGPDGRTVRFQSLPEGQRETQTLSMKTPQVLGSGVAVPANAHEFERLMESNNKYVTAFKVKGAIDDGVVQVKIWNGDTYSINLKTGEYSIDSIFLFHPDYQAEYRRTGVPVSRSANPPVLGVVQVAPANPAPTARTAAPALSR